MFAELPQVVRQFVTLAVCSVLILATTRAGATDACVGDCSGDRLVTVDELVRGVNIALGLVEADQCPAFECHPGSGVTIDCLLQGVRAALDGCTSGVASPTIEGPVSGGNGTPFVASTGFDLADVGYQQAEYFYSGTAQAYVNDGALGTDGKWGVTAGTTAAYKTRMLVYRPIDPADFNGTVIVEWLNVSGGLDSAPDWLAGHTEMIRSGFAWVGVSVQKVGVEGGGSGGLLQLPLKKQDPVRYGTLVHPGDSFSYDMYSQAAQALRHPTGIDPLGGLPFERIIAAGESQSAFRMVTYVNAIHPLAHIYDGFLVHSRGSSPAALSEPPQVAIAAPLGAKIRDDVDVPVMIFLTETDILVLGAHSAEQSDSEHVRTWEVPGSAHADTYTLLVGANDRGDSADVAQIVVTAAPLPGIIMCGSAINSGPQHWVLNAAVFALNRWVRDGTPPANAARIEVDDGPPATIRRDADGNALGGIRTPYVDAPLATLSGEGQGGSGFCFIFGTTVRLESTLLETRYPTRQDYVSAVAASTDAAVADGFLLSPDAALIEANAQTESFTGE